MSQATPRPPLALRLAALLLSGSSLASAGCDDPTKAPPQPPGQAQGTTPASPLALSGQAHGTDRPFDLAEERGKVVLVDFWASWCEPCQRELPEIAALAERHAGPDLVVIGVNEDDALDDATRFAQAQGGLGIPWIHDHDKSIAKTWKPEKMPTLFLIERDGSLGLVFAGESPTLIADLESALADRLGANNPDPAPPQT